MFVAKISVPLKLVYRFHAIPIKISARFLVGIDKSILQFIRKGKGTRRAKTVLKKKTKSGRNQSIQFQDLMYSYVV